ncbi:MAG TPA: Uma2 family endonuclease [Symbiobacteriaceae bacterium]|nr:Uma2 family endonuclease [Symbiobacteriaceae bacterium]
MTLPRRYTYADYLQMPNDQRCEIIGGRLSMTPSPSGRHQTVLMRLSAILWQFVVGTGLGKVIPAPYDVVLSDQDIVQPDILFLSTARLDRYADEGPLRTAPDLVIEILSPSTAHWDRVEKRALYARSGVQSYWLVDLKDRSITVIALPEDAERIYRLGETLTDPVLSGFAMPVDELLHLD